MSTLKHQLAQGVGLTGLSAITVATAHLVQVIVLGRLLGPETFGLVAIVIIVLMIAEPFGQLGLHEAIVARKDPTRRELASLYWFGIAWGAVAYLLLLSIVPLAVWIIGEPELGRLLPVALTGLLIAPFGGQFRALAQKSLRFGRLAAVDIATAILGLGITVASAAIWDQGAWALVWGYLARTAVRSGAFALHGWTKGPRPQRHFDRADLQGYVRFGLHNGAAIWANLVSARIDQVLIGALMGVQALGFYSMALNFTLLPMQMINPAVTQVAFPAFARLQDQPAKLRAGYLHLLRILTMVNGPVLIGIAVVAPVAVPLVVGEAWRQSIPLIQILALYALLRSVGNATGSLVMGLGRADAMFRWCLGLLLVIPPVVFAASLTGAVDAVAWSMVALQCAAFVALYVFFIRPLLGARFAQYASAVGTPALVAMAMGAAVIAADVLLAGLSPAVRLAGLVLVGCAGYAGLILVFQWRYIRQLLDIDSRRRSDA